MDKSDKIWEATKKLHKFNGRGGSKYADEGVRHGMFKQTKQQNP